jgi:phosphate transport system permease protein
VTTSPDDADPTAPAPRSGGAFTGRARKRKTSFSIKAADVAAKWIFTVGGLGVMVVLGLIVAYLVSVTMPLFGGASITKAPSATLPSGDEPARPVSLASDENKVALWVLDETGGLDVYRLDNLELLTNQPLATGNVTAASTRGTAVALGFDDGTVRLGDIAFDIGFPRESDLTPEQAELEVDGIASVGGGVLVNDDGLLRLTTVEAELRDRLTLGEDLGPSPIVRLDYLAVERDEAVLALREDARLVLAHGQRRRSLMGGGKLVLEQVELPTDAKPPGVRPSNALLTNGGDGAYLVYEDGLTLRYDLTDKDNPQVVEVLDIVPEDGVSVTASRMLLGDTTLIVGDSAGNVTGWFAAPIKRDELTDDQLAEMPIDGHVMTAAHEFPEVVGDAVVAIGRSDRDRQFITAGRDGSIALNYMVTSTTDAYLPATEKDIRLIGLSPKNDALFALTEDRELLAWDVDNRYPGSEFATLFAPIHYEGYEEPVHIWQSGGATNRSEPKQSFVPLLWGTLKATFYAMLFAVPIAILGAIYSSEFMAPSVRSVVKPTVEMMAGLPSVVLGFVGGLILAPIIGDVLAGALTLFVAVPLGLFLFGYVWQTLPVASLPVLRGQVAGAVMMLAGMGAWLYLLFDVGDASGIPLAIAAGLFLFGLGLLILWQLDAVKIRDWGGDYTPFITMVGLVLLSGLLTLSLIGPGIEWLLFYDDIREWLGRRIGLDEDGDPTVRSAAVGWVALLTPLILVALVIGFNTYLRPRLAAFKSENRRQVALLDFGRLAASAVLAVLLALGLGMILGSLGLDVRGELPSTGDVAFSIFGPFDPRNSLVIGLVMGFAVIPIIYTVSEDALSSVPNTLRSAALGAGATPWQTAVKVVLPVAISGIFSACMIGLGRAAGETMIVLMAYGGTALLDLNIFNGGRTFSANIATELPEAPKGEALYRRLFLSGVLLFMLTFFVNTLAELVRIRFRARTKGL